MNAYTPPTPADRVNAALARHKHLPEVLDHLQAYQRADIRYAQTNSTDALLEVLEAEYKMLAALEEATGRDFSDRREDLRHEALQECGFDLREDSFTDDVPVENFGASHPDAGRGFRIGGAA